MNGAIIVRRYSDKRSFTHSTRISVSILVSRVAIWHARKQVTYSLWSGTLARNIVLNSIRRQISRNSVRIKTKVYVIDGNVVVLIIAMKHRKTRSMKDWLRRNEIKPATHTYRKEMNLKEVQSYSNGKSFIFAMARLVAVRVHERLIEKNARRWISSSFHVRVRRFHFIKIKLTYILPFRALFRDTASAVTSVNSSFYCQTWNFKFILRRRILFER